MSKCANCEHELNAEWVYCPHCAEPSGAMVNIFPEQYARFVAAAPSMRDLIWEVAHHCYDKQDMERCRSRALELLKQVGAA